MLTRPEREASHELNDENDGYRECVNIGGTCGTTVTRHEKPYTSIPQPTGVRAPVDQSMLKPNNSMESEVHLSRVSEKCIGNPGNHLRGPKWDLRHTSASCTTGLRVRGFMQAPMRPTGSSGDFCRRTRSTTLTTRVIVCVFHFFSWYG